MLKSAVDRALAAAFSRDALGQPAWASLARRRGDFTL